MKVLISQNNREILDKFQFKFGGKVYGPYINPVGNNFYQWVIVRERALGFMFTIFTFLSRSRREQFKAILAGKSQSRIFQKTISEDGISEAWLIRKMREHSKDRRVKGPMKLFGVKK